MERTNYILLLKTSLNMKSIRRIIFLLSNLLLLTNTSIKAQTITLSDTATGTINGVSFTGVGYGTGNPTTGYVTGCIEFDQFPNDYTPFLSRSWKCKQHPPMIDLVNNPFSQSDGNWDAVATITYATGETLSITAQVRKPTPTTQEVIQDRTGNYTGPIDMVENLSYVDTLRPNGPGKLLITGTRSVKRSNGQIVTLDWEENVTFLDGTTLSSPQLLKYNVLSTTWDPQALIFCTETIMDISPLFESKSVPTLSEWGLIILLLLLLTLGCVSIIRQRQTMLTTASGTNFNYKTPLFDAEQFRQIALKSLPFIVVAIIIISIIESGIFTRNIIGTVLSGLIFSYLIHFILVSEKLKE